MGGAFGGRTMAILDRSCRSLGDQCCTDVAIEVGAASSDDIKMKQLYLQCNCFSSLAMEWLAAAVLWSGGLSDLSVLCLHENSIGDRGVCILFEAIRRGSLHGLERCDLSSNQVGDAGAEALGSLLEGTELPALAEVSLAANRVGSRGCDALIVSAEAAASKSPRLPCD